MSSYGQVHGEAVALMAKGHFLPAKDSSSLSVHNSLVLDICFVLYYPPYEFKDLLMQGIIAYKLSSRLTGNEGSMKTGQDIDIAGFVLHGRLHVSTIASIHGDHPIDFLSLEAERAGEHVFRHCIR